MLDEKLLEVITSPPDSAVSIVSHGEKGPHLVNTWKSYLVLTKDDRLLILAGRMRQTEENVNVDDRVLLSIANREVQGRTYVGTGFLIRGKAQFSADGPDFDATKKRYPWARAVLAISVKSAEQTL